MIRSFEVAARESTGRDHRIPMRRDEWLELHDPAEIPVERGP